MANQDKKQQRRGFMYIYKGGIGNQRKKESEIAGDMEKKSSTRSWLRRIPKIPSLNSVKGGKTGFAVEAAAVGGFVEARKSMSCLELESAEGFVEERKSLSHMEKDLSAAAGGGIVEGRKSLSHMENDLTAGGRGRIIVEARKSVSQIETCSSVAAYLQVKVLVSDMPSFMQVHAFRCARRTFDSLEKFSAQQIAHNIKKEFDKAYGPAWHCIVGSSFGSFVTHSTGCFLYFSMEKLYILLFKTKIKKAPQ
ncbi:hypothetical protein L6164_014366 [Bauhinia variegata]|uniref:Uncharacterized protein n=1 Tax=Bauhinia variegata TaxID=167791 RepID=A0ACB9NHB0_BAUVA|nr:hypothetical protein L6164_014366 [Bauhinia variegata]